MPFSPRLAAVRFGTGLSPRVAPAGDMASLLSRLSGEDRSATAYPIEDWVVFSRRIAAYREVRKGEASDRDKARALRDMRRDARRMELTWMGQTLLRRITTEDGFRERLVAFWADHFTAKGRGAIQRSGVLPYIDAAIRPHVGGSFPAMLRAVATAPVMIAYLDQAQSVGPASVIGQRSGRGVNENLAREMLELHTLGVGGGYTQADVTELAHLLAGLSITRDGSFVFKANASEPGAERVLGVSYGTDGPGRLEDIFAALDDLARHPSTVQHLARKLAVHFVSDTPDPGLVEAMAQAYAQGGGELGPVYAAMLEHPAAWDGPGTVKTPVDFVASSLRALDVRDLPMRQSDKLDLLLRDPMELMGQPWTQPEGPDGWPEEDADWITPQRLAGRLQWALNVPGVLAETLPDPRAFVDVALPGPVPEALRFAARAAETRAEGIALILSSPAFQRM